MNAEQRRLLVPCLVASAVVLAGMLASQLGRTGGLPRAGAEVFNQQSPFTMMSASIGNNEEALFVIDNASNVLLVYMVSNDNERMLLSNALPLDRLFAAAGGGETELEGGVAPEGGRERDGGRDRERNRN